MKAKWLYAAAIVLACGLTPASASETEATKGERDAKHAADKDAKPERHPVEGSQQHKMKVCNQTAHEKQLRGDERRAFMSACLRG